MVSPWFHVIALALLLAAGNAQAQGTPPFPLADPGSSSQRVDMQLSAEQDDGSHAIEISPSPVGGEQVRSQIAADTGHGRLWTIPGSVAFAIAPGGGGDISSAPLPNDSGTRSFLVFEDPVSTPSGTAPFLFAGEHFFDAQCATATCGFLDGGVGSTRGEIRSEAEASFDLVGGAIAADASAATPDYGRRFYDARPGGGSIYDHLVEAAAAAQIQDWVYVTGPGATATLVVSASIGASIDVPPVPVTLEEWSTPVYGDIRAFDPCADEVLTSDELLDPNGVQSNAVNLALSIESGFQQVGEQWLPAVSGGQGLDVTRLSDLHWADEESLPDCSDDFAEVTAGAVGTLASSLIVELVVPTDQWARVSASAASTASCLGPFHCDLDASVPAQISVTSPDGTLVSWHGIAGLTAVPEPTNGMAASVGTIALLARVRGRRREPGVRSTTRSA